MNKEDKDVEKGNIQKPNTLATRYPEIAKEWHPTKNGDLTPDRISCGTSKKVWWLCSQGHEWEAWIQTRIIYEDCPYCSNKRVSEKYNLLVVNPAVAAEWHPTKNGDLKPTDVMPGTKKKVWWLCQCGHEWQAQITNRARGKPGCRSCAAKRSAKTVNILDAYPELGKQWHPTKNLGLDPKNITTSSQVDVWWICDKGHEWQTQVASRARRDGITGCPQCNSGQVFGVSFADRFPNLVKELHPTKNQDFSPNKVSPKSNKKVWWFCDSGHEWDESIKNRANGWGCPYCSGKRVSNENCLATKNPDLANEWNHLRNGDLTPEDVTWSSGKAVWWKCSRGHEWEATISNRARGTGCPKCAPNTSHNEITLLCELRSIFEEVQWHKKIDGKEADIFISDYRIAVEYDGYHWHKDKTELDLQKTQTFSNLGITTFRVREEGLPALSKRDITHVAKERNFKLVENVLISMLANLDITDQHRLKIESYLQGKKFINSQMYRKMISYLPGPQPENSLLELFPEIAREWDTEKNSPLDPSMFSSRSSNKIWWKCNKGHSWQAAISSRTGGTGCPVCAGKYPTSDYNLAAAYPDIAKQWHSTKNGNLRPEDVRPGSNKKIWWQCEHGHEWQVCPNVRIGGTGCPYCCNHTVGSHNNLAKLFPALAQEWHPTKNGSLNPCDVTPGSRQKVWWICDKGHEWPAVINTRTRGVGCPTCKGRLPSNVKNLAFEFPAIAGQWHPEKNGGLKPTNVRSKSHKKVWWQCEKGHEWEARVADRTAGSRCPDCMNSRVNVGNCLATKNPELASQWHPSLNVDLKPTDVTLYSHAKVWWLCERGHYWKAQVQHRARGNGCPDCRKLRSRKKLVFD